jgi:hypothetical protein
MHTTASEVASPESVNVQPMLWRGWREDERAHEGRPPRRRTTGDVPPVLGGERRVGH